MSESGWEILPNVQEWSGGLPGCSGVVGRPSYMSGSCSESLTDVRERLGDSPSCPGVVGGPPDVRVLSGVPLGNLGGQPGGLGIVGTPSRMSLRGGGPSGYSAVVGRFSRLSGSG